MTLFEIIVLSFMVFLCVIGFLWIISGIFNVYSIIHNKVYDQEHSPFRKGFLIVLTFLAGFIYLDYTFQLFRSKKNE